MLIFKEKHLNNQGVTVSLNTPFPPLRTRPTI